MGLASDYVPVQTFSVDDECDSDAGQTRPYNASARRWHLDTVQRWLPLALTILAIVALGALYTVRWAAVSPGQGTQDDQEVENVRGGLFYGILNRTSVDVVPPPPLLAENDEGYVAICLSVRDQVFDLPEWLRHHYYHLGIHDFYIFDDGTIPPLSDQLSDFELGMPRSAVHFIWYDERLRATIGKSEEQQLNAYNECARMFGNRHKWMAFLDADEFLEMTDPAVSLQAFLRTHEEKAGGVGVNWIMHNSGGLVHRPPRGGLRRSSRTCLSDPESNQGEPIDNGHVKVIAQPERLVRMPNPHYGIYHEGYRQVDTDGVPMPYAWEPHAHLVTPPKRDKAMLHHYAVKSKEEFQEKIDRGNGLRAPKSWAWWDYVESRPTQPCESLIRYWP